MKEGFPCTGCGACCRRIDVVIGKLDDMGVKPGNELYFPYKSEGGKCEKLTSDNKCSVYENRPTICNIEKMMALTGMGKNEYYAINAAACNKMMDEDGLPIELRVSLNN